jgi:hypothetical protein
LARQRGELTERPELPAMAERANLVALLRSSSYSQSRIANNSAAASKL